MIGVGGAHYLPKTALRVRRSELGVVRAVLAETKGSVWKNSPFETKLCPKFCT